MKQKNIIFIIVLFTFATFSSAQTNVTTSSSDKEMANTLFDENKYTEALPYLIKAHEENPNDITITFKYGATLYELRKDLNTAVEVLTLASQKKQTEAFLYLGDVYTELYKFADAEKAYNQYAALKKKDSAAQDMVNQKLDEMGALRKIATKPENIQIVDSVVVSKSDFLSAYKLSPSSGMLAYFKDVFKANQDVNSTVYFNEKGNSIYFAQPQNGIYTLFTMDKLIDGFGNEKVMDARNFGFEEGNVNYVFVMPDGITTYLSAEDKNGLGGYDLYMTRYNMSTNSYLNPERLNMPFNSRYNDYMMAVDEEKNIGWFATDRFQPEGKVCVYTFIPNKEVKILESEDESTLTSRAMLVSIKDTWQAGKDYQPIINLAKKNTQRSNETKVDFNFVINDRYTYHYLSDFKSANARNIFTKSLSARDELQKTEENLEKNRENYVKASSSEKNSISSEIIRLEQRQENLYNEKNALQIQARNEENKVLK